MEAHLLFHLALVSSPARQRKQPAPELHKNVHHSRPHSTRSATSGSTFVARRAGIQQATIATASINSAAESNETGSVGVSLKSSVEARRATAKISGNPMATPAMTSNNASRRINQNTSRLCAPSAIRIPISLVRLLTL